MCGVNWLVFWLFCAEFGGFVLALTEFLNVEVEHQCIQRCPLQNRTDDGHYEFECDYRCSINKCVEGCKLWKNALESSCQTVCNGTLEPLSPKELYCVMSCNDAITRYFTQLRAKLGTPVAPALVADSLTATSLQLVWRFPEAKHAGLTYFVQWKYEEFAASWQYCKNEKWGADDTVVVENLQPYTKYRFRIALLLSPHSELIVSLPSVVISTLPAGVPASSPIIVRAVPIDCTHISVSWEPGPFPHGPLLSYVLHITDNHGYSALKDISAENNFYMYRDLQPLRNYTISISMTNGVGTGPAAQVQVATPAEPAAKDVQQPVLILSSHHIVIEQGADMLEVPVVLYKTEEFIKGLAIHIKKRLLFVSDSSSTVHRITFTNFTNDSESTPILAPPLINFLPLELSVDWLNDQLYILGEVTHQWQVWQITRCGLDGHGQQVALAGLRSKPLHIEVDPYNGYLFWVIQGTSGGGLYRLDLSDISNGIKHDVHPEVILAETNLGAFTVDYTNFRLLCSNQNENTINSVSLDGKEVVNVRPKIIARKLQTVLSLATANKTFYWTDGYDVFYEEYHPSRESYYHNAYPDLADRPYLKVIVNLQSTQPTPIPINPPTALQAIFGPRLVRISWNAPHLLGEQGKGAWQDWLYEVSLRDTTNNLITIHKNINLTSCVIQNLLEDTTYIIRVGAYTTLGKGPWSSEFQGKTLKYVKDGKYPVILWSSANGLLKSDATGENVQTLVPKSMMKNYVVTDVAWYEDRIYYSTNGSQIFWYDMVSQEVAQIEDIDSASSITVDWIGKKLYWSNPKQQLILRGNFNGTHKEPLPILTLAKELNIDAVEAYLYWSTGHAVECSRLNGAERFVYHPAQLFSGKQVMGLTLDMNSKTLYWIIRDSEGSTLFKAPMIVGSATSGVQPVPEAVSVLQKPDMQGPLCYFNNRLLWLKDDRNAVISDLKGKNVANINGKDLFGLTMIYVMDVSLHAWPNSSHKINVIPEPVEKSSIQTVGTWINFNITWGPTSNVNYGTVFYEIKVNGSSRTTTLPTIKYWQEEDPFTKLDISVRAYTYWGAASLARVKIHSPPSTPHAPDNLRTYVSYRRYFNDTRDVLITFRWDAPLVSNGIVEGYKIRCWYVEDYVEIDLCEDVFGSFKEREYVVTKLREDEIYYFQVQAYNEIGQGEPSQIMSVNTSQEIPLPKLLVASSNTLFVQDVDQNKNYTLLHGISTPIEIAYIIKENKIFWINDMKELFMLNVANSNRSKILDLTGNPVSLTVDWLERSLYYVVNEEGIFGVYKLDLNGVEKGIVKSVVIFKQTVFIAKMEVSPFTRKLYWTELNEEDTYVLKQCNTDGADVRLFFNQPFSIEKTFAIDHSSLPFNLIYLDSQTNDVITADLQHSHNYHTILKNVTLPFNLKCDSQAIYWTNSSQGVFYVRRNGQAVNSLQITPQNFAIFGTHAQPYPPFKCLIPDESNVGAVLTLLNKTATVLTLSMPEIRVANGCGNVSLPTVEYKVSYRRYDVDVIGCEDDCLSIATFEKMIVVENLLPFSKYVFWMGADNYFYRTVKGRSFSFGSPIVFQTAEGAPSKPESITATVLNPTEIEVSWLPPKEINGESIWYEVHWQTEGDINGIRQKGEQIVPTADANKLQTRLRKLSPNETYSIWVRAYSRSDEMATDSEGLKIQTFPEPDNFTLVNSSTNELVIQTNEYASARGFIVQAAYFMSNDWTNVSHVNSVNGTTFIRVSNLKPKTQYKFRLVLTYPDYFEQYLWPTDARFIFETLGDRPSPPNAPLIQHLKGDVYQVLWESPQDNGAPIECYLLEGLQVPSYRNKRSASTNRSAWYYNSPFIEENEYNWTALYNGTDTFWIISGLDDRYKYTFHVSAKNSYGWSLPSEESVEFDVNIAAQLAEKPDPMHMITIAIGVPAAICLSLVVCFVFCKWYCTKDKTKEVVVMPRGPDVELATLRELPRRWIHNTNILYTANQCTSDEITMLPHIRRDQITLMKFLGSGAFGEVFEGKAKNIIEEGAEINVAVKTLRKGASEVEKCEFLQEAQLMSHFKHDHILQLLGVCLDNDPQFIIMELMQGGDLLTYLRTSRNPAITSTPALTLSELLKMCVDVSKGCRYLEEMHFVHRDLACRNCLVSSVDPNARIVKIGDFGLTRDIYKNDYYRKEGEGLLPVRWMAPESLVDGVFTCQSDVWAFGVLLWEIMTLGQQPYPARNNLEVLHYVKSGGRLGKPVDCPEQLHELMLMCWNYEPERRPTFKFCLSLLEELYVQVANDPSTGVHEGQYISTVPLSIATWKSPEEESDKELTPFLQPETSGPQQIPTYLELIYDGDNQDDGYEIPTPSFKNDTPELLESCKKLSRNVRSESQPENEDKHSYVNRE